MPEVVGGSGAPAEGMLELAIDINLCNRRGAAGIKRVAEVFGFDRMAEEI